MLPVGAPRKGKSSYGAGTVRHLGGDRYRVYYSVGSDPVTGKPVRKSPTIRAASSRAAWDELARLRSAEQDRRDVETLGAILAEYHDAAHGMSPTTKAEQQEAVARYLTPAMAARRLRDLGPRDLDKLYVHLMERGGVCRLRDTKTETRKCPKKPCPHGGGNALAPSTVERFATVIEAALEQAVRWGYIKSNPAKLTRPISIDEEEVQLPPAEDLVKILAHLDTMERDGHGVDGSPLPDFVACLLGTGARPGELCALRWGETGADHRRLTIKANLTRARGGAVRKATKTRKIRRVRVAGPVTTVLAERQERWLPLAEAADMPLEDMAVFPSKDRPEQPWRPDSMGREFRRVRDELGLSKQITFRNLRHDCVSVLAAAKVDIVTIARRMGHNPATMLRVYAHLLEEADDEAAEILAARLAPGTTSG